MIPTEKRTGDEADKERQKSHVEVGIVAMENLLDGGNKEDAVYVLENIIGIVRSFHDHPHVSVTFNIDDAIENAVESLDIVVSKVKK